MVRNRSKSDQRTGMRRFFAFLFPSQTDTWLRVLRIGLGMQTILYALSLREDWTLLFRRTDETLVSRALAEKLLSLESPVVPRLSWLVNLGPLVGLAEDTVLLLLWIALLCAGIGLVVGILSRACAVGAWFLHLCAAKSGGVLSYGVDNFMTIGLFYLMLAPASPGWSLMKSRRKVHAQDRHLSGFFRRVLQIHLCIIYFFSGLTKCLGSGWWNGSNLWLALTRPPSNFIAPDILLSWKQFLPAVGILICLLEIGYPFFIWPDRTRTIWLAAVLAMHLAIGLTMGLYLFGLVMIVLNVAAFAPEHLVGGATAIFRSLRGSGPFSNRRSASDIPRSD